MQAMILAAGFGTRLLPYTKYLPKPLFPVLNTPLLLAAVNRLKSSGFSKIIVNCHHLGEQIVTCLRDIPGISYSTGGSDTRNRRGGAPSAR